MIICDFQIHGSAISTSERDYVMHTKQFTHNKHHLQAWTSAPVHESTQLQKRRKIKAKRRSTDKKPTLQ